MRIRNANWSETNVQYECQAEDGPSVKAKEAYVIDTFTFGGAEDVITKEMASYSSGEFVIKNIMPAAYSEIFFSNGGADDKWYKAKLMFITIDKEKGKEKRMTVSYLVQAKNIEGVPQNVGEVFSSSMLDYVMANASETKIMDVFEHDLKKEPDDQPEV